MEKWLLGVWFVRKRPKVETFRENEKMGLVGFRWDAFGSWVFGGIGIWGVWLVGKCGKVEIFQEDKRGALVGFLRDWLKSSRVHEYG